MASTLSARNLLRCYKLQVGPVLRSLHNQKYNTTIDCRYGIVAKVLNRDMVAGLQALLVTSTNNGILIGCCPIQQ